MIGEVYILIANDIRSLIHSVQMQSIDGFALSCNETLPFSLMTQHVFSSLLFILSRLHKFAIHASSNFYNNNHNQAYYVYACFIRFIAGNIIVL